ncbi:MAG: hypothetical protein REI11_08340, partial [Patulibacter sp.]|nr:hypothetical protein [Patulibacter sp.]
AGGHGAQSAKQVTGAGPDYATASPAVSPDGTRVAFAQRDTGDARFHIHVVNIDGTGDHELDPIDGSDTTPAWTPSGNDIVFSRTPTGGNSDLWIMGADGGAPTQLTADAGADLGPEVSPDGNRVAWTHQGSTRQIMVGALRHPTPGTAVTGGECDHQSPTWSPDGTKLAFETQDAEVPGGSCAGQNIDVVPIDVAAFPIDLTSGAYDVTRRVGQSNTDPVWSPDGTTIAFTSQRTDPSIPPNSFRTGIWLMNTDGSNVRLLTNSQYQYGDQYPSWVTIPSPTEVTTPVNTDPGTGGRTPTPSPTPTATGPVGGTIGPVGGVVTPPPPVKLAVAAAKLKAKAGAATVPLTVPGPGTVKVTGTGLSTSSGKAKAAGAFSLKLHLTAAEAKKLRKAHKVKITATVRFTPASGAPTTTKTTLTIT